MSIKDILELSAFKDMPRLEISSERVKRVSMILAAASAVFFMAELLYLLASYALPFRSVPAQAVTVPAIAKANLESLDAFESKLGARNLFFSPVKEAPAAAAGIEEKVKNLSLIGIVATGEPEAIVKDSSINQTYFLKRHQKLRDLEVKEVKSTSIVLKSGKEEKEIFLV